VAILAIDTSTSVTGVSVYDGSQGGVLAETIWRSGRNHSRALLQVIDGALSLGGTPKESLTAIALASGPGSYSGLRVGASVAIGLGLALGIEVIQVPTLEILAFGFATSTRPIRAAVEVGRGRYATARFAVSGVAGDLPPPPLHRPVQETEITSSDVPSLLALACAEGAFLAAELDAAVLASERELGHEPPLMSTPAQSVRRASYLAELADARLTDGSAEGERAGDLIYLRD
jgi:tRNA threonylcarbamoyladenosine biosynthesis protein TsaB